MDSDLKVLVIGSTGRVGRMLRRYWQGSPPRGMSLSYQARQGADVTWQAQDGPEALSAQGRFDRLLVLAGVTAGQNAELQQNALIARNCLSAAARMGAEQMLLASSSAVYRPHRTRPCVEADTPAPASAYGKAKLAAEQAVENGAVPVCALRIGNVLGADALMANAVRASAEQPLRLDRFGDGRGPLRSYIGPATLAQVLETLLRASTPLPERLNIAAPAPTAMQALLEACATPYVMRPAPVDAVQNITLDCTALAALHRFDAGAATAEHMLAQWQRLRDPA